MNEEQEKPAQESAPERREDGPSGGELLARARREQQISIHEIAKELHLDEIKVRALERNEFDILGAAVFAKGHLRKYAQLVGVDEADILTDYHKMTRTADLPPVVGLRQRTHQELSPGPWIAVIAVVVVAAAAYWWFGVTARAPSVEMQTPVVESPQEPAIDPAMDEQEPDAQEDVVEETPAGEADAGPSEPEPEPEPVDDGLTQLSLTFSGDCWTEISDAAGQRLYFNMGRAGRTVELTGKAPFKVLFGNAENVNVLVDGNAYPVRPGTPGSRTARLTINMP